MLEKYIRPGYQAFFVDPLARFFIQLAPLSPNSITFAGCFFGLVSAALIAYGSVWLAIVFLFLSGFCDTMDGTVARLKKRSSSFGTALDIVCDRVVEAAIIFGLFLFAPDSRAIVSLLMMASILICVTSFLVVGIFSENQTEKGFFYSPGLIERGEAFLFFVLLILAPSVFVLLGSIFAFLVVLTAVMRLVQFANI